ncbi:MAG: hypothetical protein Q9175_003564 [Cornicularia normoerica]
MASDGCNQIGKGYGPITTSFAPGELSTIAGGSTNVFNFADLPCGPSAIELPPGSPYAPLISPPPFIWALDPAFSNCIPGRNQGVDPPIAVTSDGGPQGPGPVAPWAPTKTAGPTYKDQL